jgi:transposase
MTVKRQRYGAEFKAKVALEAIRDELTTSQLASKHGVHQTMINDWKRLAIAGLASLFDGKGVEKEVARAQPEIRVRLSARSKRCGGDTWRHGAVL